MTQHQLDQKEQARATLACLREIVKRQAEPANSEDVRDLQSEAETLLGTEP